MPSTSEDKTSQRLVSLLETFTRGGVTVEELEYTAELLIAIAEEEATVRDRSKLVVSFIEVMRKMTNSEEDHETFVDKQRRLRKERLETQFAIGKSCLVVLEEDNAWHPARIIKHLDNNDVEYTADADRVIEIEIEFIEFGKKQIVREDRVVLNEDVAGREEMEDMTGLCEMCERPLNLTAHHVIPRVTHSKYLRKGYTKEFLNTCIMICRQCHSKIHSVEDNKTLAREYNTLEKIMQHPEIIAWVAYARKQKARIKPQKQSKWSVRK
ncbi:unnamed protein product [Peronospora farinosa]|uniref:Tudor domain-containing protein n=1 Tax=Peronospora farinosa TaxID=134698 RepID=A0ABN8CKC7_9STRA|nr:unnamed protein product [Peronospora farinosa]